MTELQNSLPSGWDRQFDKKSGRYYFINHYNKTTTWDDPRYKARRYPNVVHVSNTPTENIPLQDLQNVSRSGSRTARLQDTSLTTASTEDAVTKISAMFPTVSDTHIRLLLKKYMKSIFPKADETVILDILISNDNNIQKASDILKEMGYEKRDSTKSLSHQLTPKPEAVNVKQEPAKEAPSTSMQRKSLGDKRMITAQLQEKYKDIPEQVIIIALESVGYDEERANHILHQMVQEESDKQANVNSSDAENEVTEVVTVPQAVALTISTSQSRQSLKSLLKTEKNDSVLKDICSFSRVVEEPDKSFCYRSEYLTGTCGANKNLVKGANQELLLEDYVKWQGSQPSLHKGPQRGLAKGSNSALLTTRNYQPCGSNTEFQKGPQSPYVKGSFLLHMKLVAVAESRGK